VSSQIETQIICDHCNKKYFEKDLLNFFQIKRSDIQNTIKKDSDKEKIKKQVTLYRCRSCGHALRVKKHERPEQPEK
jgi:DNA-directed RNA polymerase subunit RPC12/RpoP